MWIWLKMHESKVMTIPFMAIFVAVHGEHQQIVLTQRARQIRSTMHAPDIENKRVSCCRRKLSALKLRSVVLHVTCTQGHAHKQYFNTVANSLLARTSRCAIDTSAHAH